MPIVPLLGLLFVGLKLTGHIDWSWVWVLLPFWGGLAFVLVMMLIGLLGAGAVLGLRSGRRRR